MQPPLSLYVLGKQVETTTRQTTRGAAGRGLEKLSRGLEKILGVGLNFKNDICPAHPRPDVGLEKLQALCEAYAKSIKQDHK